MCREASLPCPSLPSSAYMMSALFPEPFLLPVSVLPSYGKQSSAKTASCVFHPFPKQWLSCLCVAFHKVLPRKGKDIIYVIKIEGGREGRAWRREPLRHSAVSSV